jgi:hypothetical protein
MISQYFLNNTGKLITYIIEREDDNEGITKNAIEMIVAYVTMLNQSSLEDAKRTEESLKRIA